MPVTDQAATIKGKISRSSCVILHRFCEIVPRRRSLCEAIRQRTV